MAIAQKNQPEPPQKSLLKYLQGHWQLYLMIPATDHYAVDLRIWTDVRYPRSLSRITRYRRESGGAHGRKTTGSTILSSFSKIITSGSVYGIR